MFEVTPQERTALLVITVLIAGGAAARHTVNRAEAREWLAYTTEAADSLDPATGSSLRARVEAEVALERIRSQPLAAGERIDVNRAPPEQLDRLPRVGPALADRIVADRESAGPYRSVEDLDRVSGIGPALLEAIRPHVEIGNVPASVGSPGGRFAVSGDDRVDINRAGADELVRLPGVGPAIAERIVTYRDANGPFATFDDLEAVSGIGPRLRERIEAVARLGR
jgi:competence protein ComEA